jgi:hypothetical protein
MVFAPDVRALKADVALYSHVDPMTTISRLAAAMGIPEGAFVHYVLRNSQDLWMRFFG